MATKKQNEMKAKIWTGTLTAEISGSISACVIEAFGYIMEGSGKTAAEVRQLALNLMQQRHEELSGVAVLRPSVVPDLRGAYGPELFFDPQPGPDWPDGCWMCGIPECDHYPGATPNAALAAWEKQNGL